MQSVFRDRIQQCNSKPINGSGDYVLYWMVAARRRHYNFALQRAVEWAVELRKPLLIVEALNLTYRWSSARFHTFVLQGMLNNLRAFENADVLYYPFVERFPAHGKGMIVTLAQHSCVVVTDDFPAFELPRWIEVAASAASVLVEKIDSNGILPMRAAGRMFTTAVSFRRFLQTQIRQHLDCFPVADALDGAELPPPVCPEFLRQRWPAATRAELSFPEALVDAVGVDQAVGPVSIVKGGPDAAREHLRYFVQNRLAGYAENRNDLSSEYASGLSPYLHFGHISAHEIFLKVTDSVRWTPDRLPLKATGSREGWWNGGPDVEAFLDQLITWRELGFNMCVHTDDYDNYRSLPQWAAKTLSAHVMDPRPVRYSRQQLEAALTHDVLWNAAQTQLLEEGRIHNYLRMLWGKKIVEWSSSPEEALETMIELNNKYALDGRDPNSYSGIFWILGRYDRPWGPERPIFGVVRYMSSANTARKLNVREYVRRYSKECVR